MSAADAAPRKVRERMIRVPVALVTQFARNSSGEVTETLVSKMRFESVEVDPIEEARLESLSALAPVGATREQVEAEQEHAYHLYASRHGQTRFPSHAEAITDATVG